MHYRAASDIIAVPMADSYQSINDWLFTYIGYSVYLHVYHWYGDESKNYW